MGFDLRDAVPGPAGAPRRNGASDRRTARRVGHARRHDRHRQSVLCGRPGVNGVHDLGGMHGMGPIAPEPNEPVFHERWEARAYALNGAAGACRKWNIDTGRHSRERIPPAEYLHMSYYEKWLAGLVMLLEESGLVTRAELESSRPAPGTAKAVPALAADQVAPMIARGRSFMRPVNRPPRFALGQHVRARKI